MKKKKGLISLLIALILMLALPAGTFASTQKILVYTGDSSWNNGYSKFSLAAGKELDESDILPGNLSAYSCIVLPANRSEFSTDTVAALVAFVKKGGKIIAQADQGDTGFFQGAIDNMNNLAGALGSSLVIEAASIDSGFHTTTNVGPSPFTDDVLSIMYGWTSKVKTGPGAFSLVRTQGGPTDNTIIVGAEKIGKGWLVLCGDLNIFSDFPETGYTEHDNGLLARNICDGDEELGDDITATIDIKPDSEHNTINPGSKGVVPVAIMHTDDFDVAEVDPSSVILAGAVPVRWKMEDVDDDGNTDLLFHFRTQELSITGDMTELTLSGETMTGQAFSGTDSINIVPRK